MIETAVVNKRSITSTDICMFITNYVWRRSLIPFLILY